MKATKRFAQAGMDTDSSREYFDAMDITFSFNIRTLGTDEGEAGVVTSIEGNEIVSNPLPIGTNKCIGAKSFDDVDRAYYFVYNENNFHRIEEYNYATNTISTIIENITDSGGIDIFKWPSSTFVKDIELIDSRHLKWNDAVSSPKEIDVQRIRDGEYGVITALDIEQIKEQPMIPIKVKYFSNPSKNSNSMARKLFQFKYKYIYWNNEESANSEYSRREVPSNETTPASVSDVTQNNGQILELNIGTNRVREIIVYARYDLLDWKVIKRVNTSDIKKITSTYIDVQSERLESYDPLTGVYGFLFYNDGVQENEDPLSADQMYDHLPDVAAGMELANGNVMLFSGIREGKKRPTTGFQLGVTYYDPQIDITPTDLSNALNYSYREERVSGSHRRRIWITLRGIPRGGDKITLTVRNMENNNLDNLGTYTVKNSEEGNLQAVAESMKNTYRLWQQFTDTNGFHWDTEPYWVMHSMTFEYANKTTGQSKSVHSLKTNSAYQVGLAYRGKFGKLFPLQTGTNAILNTKSLAQVNGLLPQFDWRLLDVKAPEGAVDYQWVISPNNTTQKFLQMNGTFKEIDEQGYISISMKSILKFNKANPSSLITYDFAPGDRCTFISRVINDQFDFFIEKPIDVDVIAFKPVVEGDPGKEKIVDYVLTVRRPASIDKTGKYNGSVDLTSKEIVIEIYTPKSSSSDQETQVYYEVGEVYPIDANGNHTVMSGSIREGDCYFKTRELEYSLVDNKFSIFHMEDSNFSDYYKSNYYSYGRPRSYYDTPEEVFLKASVRFSATFNKYTNNNGLTRFFAENMIDYDEKYGIMWYLEQRDNVVIAVQELKVGYIPIQQSVTEDQAGQANVMISDQLLNKIRYSKGINIGIGNAIKSFTSYGSYVYFIDPNRCEPIRVGLDGVVSISKKMNKFFKKTIRNAYETGREIIGYYDIFNNEFLISFTTVDQQTISIPFKDSSWRVTDTYVMNPSDLVVNNTQFNGTSVYDSSTGIARFTPTRNYFGPAGIKFTFNAGGEIVERGECITVNKGQSTMEPLVFMDQLDVPINTAAVSSVALVRGINAPQDILVEDGKMRVNGGEWKTGTVEVNDGDQIELYILTGPSYSTKYTARIQYNAGSEALFNATTIGRDFPDPFDFGIIADVGLSTITESLGKVFPELTIDTSISVASGEVSMDGGPWVKSGILKPGQTVKDRLMSSTDLDTLVTDRITIGGVVGNFAVRTRKADSISVKVETEDNKKMTIEGLVNGVSKFKTSKPYIDDNFAKENDLIKFIYTSDIEAAPWLSTQKANVTVKGFITELYNKDFLTQVADLGSIEFTIPIGGYKNLTSTTTYLDK